MLDLQALRVLTVRQERPALPGLKVYKVRRVILGHPDPKAKPDRKDRRAQIR